MGIAEKERVIIELEREPGEAAETTAAGETTEVVEAAETTAAGEMSNKREVTLTPSRTQYKDTTPKKQRTVAAAATSNSPLRDDTVERSQFTPVLQHRVHFDLSQRTKESLVKIHEFEGSMSGFVDRVQDTQRFRRGSTPLILFGAPCETILDGVDVTFYGINVVDWPRAKFFAPYGWVWIGNEGDDDGKAVFVRRLLVVTETEKGGGKKGKGKGK